jgi:hypothetical protein
MRLQGITALLNLSAEESNEEEGLASHACWEQTA